MHYLSTAYSIKVVTSDYKGAKFLVFDLFLQSSLQWYIIHLNITSFATQYQAYTHNMAHSHLVIYQWVTECQNAVEPIA